MIRTIIGLALGNILLALGLPAEAQQPTKIARIGYLSVGDSVSRGYRIEAFRQGLKELGYVEGKDIIFAGGTPATEAAKNATLTLPIVTSSDDPVGRGLVAGLPRPGGNITGLTNLSVELVGKRLELLKEVIPGLSRVALLCNPSNPRSDLGMRETEIVAESLGVQLQVAEIRDRDDLEPAFAALRRDRAGALITIRTPLIVNNLAKRIIDLADKSRLPAIYDDRIFPKLGGLMSYGVNLAELDRRAATYIDKILKGAKPADLPVEQPTKFDMVINLKTAKALGLKIPAHLLMEADRVIE
jgi:putative ABC transport system substrate-binding protein